YPGTGPVPQRADAGGRRSWYDTSAIRQPAGADFHLPLGIGIEPGSPPVRGTAVVRLVLGVWPRRPDACFGRRRFIHPPLGPDRPAAGGPLATRYANRGGIGPSVDRPLRPVDNGGPGRLDIGRRARPDGGASEGASPASPGGRSAATRQANRGTGQRRLRSARE